MCRENSLYVLQHTIYDNFQHLIVCHKMKIWIGSLKIHKKQRLGLQQTNVLIISSSSCSFIQKGLR